MSNVEVVFARVAYDDGPQFLQVTAPQYRWIKRNGSRKKLNVLAVHFEIAGEFGKREVVGFKSPEA